MFKSTGWLVLGHLLLVFEFASFVHSNSGRSDVIYANDESWKTIDDYLSKEAADDSEKLMRRAISLLKKEQGMSIPFFVQKDEKKIVTNLEKVSQLADFVETRSCSQEAIDLRQYLFDEAKLGGHRKLEQVVFAYGKKLALICQKEYAKRHWRKADELFNLEKLDKLHWFLMEVIIIHLNGAGERFGQLSKSENNYKDRCMHLVIDPRKRHLLVEFIAHDLPIVTRFNAEIAHDIANYLFRKKEHLTGKWWLLEATKAQEVVTSLFQSRCNELIDFLGAADWQDMAYSDLPFLDSDDYRALSGIGLNQFYLAWAESSICWRLVRNREERNQFLEMIGKVAERTERIFPYAQNRMYGY